MPLNVSDGFPYYIELAGTGNAVELFTSAGYIGFLSSLSEQQAASRYAPGKWSIKQITGHVTDHERIMTYRALRISRRDATPLPGYEQDLYVENARFDEIAFEDLLADLKNVRQATISLIKSFSDQQLQLTGKVWKYELSVEEILKATVGHEIHHLNIIKERYLN